MKKNYLLFIFLLGASLSLPAQRISKKEARQILESAWLSLQTSDTAAFVKLWHLDQSPWPYHQRPYTQKDVVGDFRQMREFLDTAISRGLQITDIEITRATAGLRGQYFGKYKIRGWFKYADNYYKGFGFFVDPMEGRWYVRFSPDTSFMITTKDTSRAHSR